MGDNLPEIGIEDIVEGSVVRADDRDGFSQEGPASELVVLNPQTGLMRVKIRGFLFFGRRGQRGAVEGTRFYSRGRAAAGEGAQEQRWGDNLAGVEAEGSGAIPIEQPVHAVGARRRSRKQTRRRRVVRRLVRARLSRRR